MLKRICVYCEIPHPIPAHPGDEQEHGVSHGMCLAAFARANDQLDREGAAEIRRAQEERR